jgi:hypothetical protein
MIGAMRHSRSVARRGADDRLDVERLEAGPELPTLVAALSRSASRMKDDVEPWLQSSRSRMKGLDE